MNLPSKLQAGMPFKRTIVETINKIIDYLGTQKIIGDQNTIKVSQGNNGVFLTVPQRSFNLPSKKTEGGIDIPTSGVLIPLAISGTLRWFPLSGFGLLTYSEEYSEQLSGTIYDVSVAQTPLSSEGEFVLTNYNEETSGYYHWVGVDDCDIECPDDVQVEQQWVAGGE